VFVAISRKYVLNIAKLASLRIEAEEVDSLACELDSILHWIDQLKNCDVSEIVLSTDEKTMPERADIVTESSKVEAVLANAPDPLASFFSVPKVL
jgi:aspartyl/glutamyl-tRNA(Asn/Gln) amidotransferase C subunit